MGEGVMYENLEFAYKHCEKLVFVLGWRIHSDIHACVSIVSQSWKRIVLMRPLRTVQTPVRSNRKWVY